MKKSHHIIASILILLDQSCKWLALNGYIYHATLGIVSWKMTKNYGVTLSWLNQLPPPIIIILQLCVLGYFCRLNMPSTVKMLFFAGGISNLLDRIFHGYVIDYLYFHYQSWAWPAVVNLADLYLSFGFIYWIYHSLQDSSESTSIFSSSTLQSD
jgi:signal peptidase II